MSSIPLNYRVARFIGHQHYIRRGRDRLIRLLLTNPEYSLPIPFEVDFFGSVYRGDLDDFIDWSVYIYGAYSNNELQLLADIAQCLRVELKHITFYDVGANVGQHTLFMSKHSDAVVSFEPFEPVRKKLLHKLIENQVGNATVFPIGLGARDEDLEFCAPVGANRGTGTFRGSANGHGRLTVRKGESFLATNELPRIDILKVDVEGFESEVFLGLGERLRRDRPVILTEISGVDRSGFRTLEGFTRAMYDDFELFTVGCTSISGTYRIMRPTFGVDGGFLVVPREREGIIERIKSSQENGQQRSRAVLGSHRVV
jgi:FkbM family methyltransferase